MNRNLKIRQISIPERNDNNELTGIDILLDVVSMEKLKSIISTPDGGTLTTEEIYFVCFENTQGNPKNLHIINADSKGEIKVTKYENHGRKSTKHRSSHRGNTRTN